MIISINTAKAFDKIQHLYLIKKKKVKIKNRKESSNLIRGIYKILTENIILNGKRLNVFLLTPWTNKECTFLPLLFKTVVKNLVSVIRQEKKYIRHPDCKGRRKILYIHRLHDCLHTNSQGIYRKAIRTNKCLAMSQGEKDKYKNQLHF